MFASPSQGKNSPVVFVGTYTEPEESRSEGVYAYRMDPSSGKLTFEKMLKGIVNPAFLGIHPRQGFLYAVSEVQGFAGQAGGGPALPGDFKDENLCADVHVSPDGKYLYGSNSHF